MLLHGKIAVVTGANGFLGFRVVRRLLAEGMAVRALVRRPEACGDLVLLGAQLVQGDVTDAEPVARATEGAHLVVHTAATPGPDRETSLKVNGEGTRTVARAALAAGVVRFVHISSDAVYDFTVAHDIIETTPINLGGNPYEEGKVAAEREVLAAAEQGLQATILRPTCILGAHATSTWGVKVPLALRNGRWKLFGAGESTFPYIHVENLVDCILLAATRPEAAGQAYDTNDGHTTWREWAAYFERAISNPAPQFVPGEQAPPFFRWTGTISAAKIRRDLGYVPARTYEEGMAEAVNYLSTNGFV
jgi:nucleoside-diphosphate-sugar epimerase